MNKILIFIIIVLVCVIVVVYRKYTVIAYNAEKEYKISVNSSGECSYIIWFNIKTWNDKKKILFKKTTEKDDFIVFIGDLRNIIYIYSIANDRYMVPYNNCLTDSTNTFGTPESIDSQPATVAECKQKCIGSTSCVGFTFNIVEQPETPDTSGSDGVTGTTGIPTCYISNNTEDIFKSSNCLFSELKLIEIKKLIPLQIVVKLAITVSNNNMIVYIDDKLINTFLLDSTISSGTITVTPDGFGFDGDTYFKYFTECLNHEKIKKYSIKL